MADPLVGELQRRCRGTVEAAVPLASYTTLKVGGPARVLVVAEDDTDLAAVGELCRTRDIPILVLGRGSNLLVTDAGWPGVALVLGRRYRGLRADGARVGVGAAEPLPAVARALAARGLSGFEFAVAVPGSVGGAVRMNAGAHGREIADVLVEVEVVDVLDGQRRTVPAAALDLGYRRSALAPTAVVVSATLVLEPADPATIAARMHDIRRWRRAHQPLSHPNCGSVFTNPPGASAGALIEAAGLKGTRIGGARISEVHANFIVTEPGATAADVLALIALAQHRVRERTGVELTPEVVIVGDR